MTSDLLTNTEETSDDIYLQNIFWIQYAIYRIYLQVFLAVFL